jgi:hypothetical protein
MLSLTPRPRRKSLRSLLARNLMVSLAIFCYVALSSGIGTAVAHATHQDQQQWFVTTVQQ